MSSQSSLPRGEIPSEVHEYLGNALRGADYLHKYRANEKAVTKAITRGAVKSMQHGGWLWIEDRDFRTQRTASAPLAAAATETPSIKKIFWSVYWALMVLCTYSIWAIAGPEVRHAFAQSNSSSQDAAPLAAVITIWKVGMLFPFWLIWRQK